MTPLCQRNDIARIKALILAGALPVNQLTEIEVRHAPDCLMARRLSASCSCVVGIYLGGAEVRLPSECGRPVVEKSA